MSFSQLARVGYQYKKPKRSGKTRKSRLKKQIQDDIAAKILTDRINTVHEETDESFEDETWEVENESHQRNSVHNYRGSINKNPLAKSIPSSLTFRG